jgi:hypothetical protein
MAVMTFIRFVVGADDDNHRQLTGVIAEARFLRDADELSPDEARRLEDTYRWLNENLPQPPYSSSDWPDDVAAWFKDDAQESISRMWDLAALLREHDVPVRMLRSKNPGRIVYEDRFQVVVAEYKSL